MANNLQIALNFAGNELFDVVIDYLHILIQKENWTWSLKLFFFEKDKNKYEIASGSLKSSDELVEVYLDLLIKNERIKMLIEPFALNVIFLFCWFLVLFKSNAEMSWKGPVELV